MQEHQISIVGNALGSAYQLTSFHYGNAAKKSQKIYIQAGLHANETPGVLVIHKLKAALLAAEISGDLLGQVIVLPVANPIGLNQTMMSYQMGRFDHASGENFNRNFPLLCEEVTQRVRTLLTQDAQHNVAVIRTSLIQLLQEKTNNMRPVDALRCALYGLACDADVVLDLHCDCESVLHLYTHTACLEQVLPLSISLDAAITLYSDNQGGQSFEEVLVKFWLNIQNLLPKFPIPLPTSTATVELRGQLDVDHGLAQQDANGILQYLCHLNILKSSFFTSTVTPPQISREAICRPLEAVDVIYAKTAGVIVYHVACGMTVDKGQAIVDVINPISGETDTYVAQTSGIFFARQNRRYATIGMDLSYISGQEVLRTGALLSN